MNASIKLLISAFIFGIATSCGAKEKKSQPIIEVKENTIIKEIGSWLARYSWSNKGGHAC